MLSVFVACLLFTVSHAQDDEDVLDAPDALDNDEYAEVEEAERAFLLVRKSITEQSVIQVRCQQCGPMQRLGTESAGSDCVCRLFGMPIE